MPRQLRDKGGIASVTPREKYGLGSKIKERFRKLIPNELADVAVKAAPFVAPFVHHLVHSLVRRLVHHRLLQHFAAPFGASFGAPFVHHSND